MKPQQVDALNRQIQALRDALTGESLSGFTTRRDRARIRPAGKHSCARAS
jgi:hypothetical protein